MLSKHLKRGLALLLMLTMLLSVVPVNILAAEWAEPSVETVTPETDTETDSDATGSVYANDFDGEYDRTSWSDGRDRTNDLPKNWTCYQYEQITISLIEGKWGAQDGKMLFLQNSDNKWVRSTVFAVGAGYIYTVNYDEMDYVIGENYGGYAAIVFTDAANNILATNKQDIKNGAAAQEWTAASFAAQAPAGAVRAYIEFGIRNAIGDPTFGVDNLEVYAEAGTLPDEPTEPTYPIEVPGDGILVNGGFEYGTDGWNIYGTTISVIDTDKASGNHSVRVATAGSAVGLLQVLDGIFYENEVYTLTFRYKHVSGERTPYIGVWFYRDEMTNANLVDAPIVFLESAPDEWTLFEMDFEVPAGANIVQVGIGYVSYDSGDTCAYLFDDFTVQPYFDVPEPTTPDEPTAPEMPTYPIEPTYPVEPEVELVPGESVTLVLDEYSAIQGIFTVEEAGWYQTGRHQTVSFSLYNDDRGYVSWRIYGDKYCTWLEPGVYNMEVCNNRWEQTTFEMRIDSLAEVPVGEEMPFTVNPNEQALYSVSVEQSGWYTFSKNVSGIGDYLYFNIEDNEGMNMSSSNELTAVYLEAGTEYLVRLRNRSEEVYTGTLTVGTAPLPQNMYLYGNSAVAVGQITRISIGFEPYYSGDICSWSFSGDTVVEVVNSGANWIEVMGLSAGQVTVTATTDSGLTASRTWTVVEPIVLPEDETARVTVPGEGMVVFETSVEQDGYYILRINQIDASLDIGGWYDHYDTFTDYENNAVYYRFYFYEEEPAILTLWNYSGEPYEYEVLLKQAQMPEQITITGAPYAFIGNEQVYSIDYGSPWAFVPVNWQCSEGVELGWNGARAYVRGVTEGTVVLTATSYENEALTASIGIEIIDAFEISVNEEQEVTLDANGQIVYKFTPEVSGAYRIRFGTVEIGYSLEQVYEDGTISMDGMDGCYYLNAGSTYKLYLHNYYGDAQTVTVEVQSLDTLVSGGDPIITLRQYNLYYGIEVEESGWYIIEATPEYNIWYSLRQYCGDNWEYLEISSGSYYGDETGSNVRYAVAWLEAGEQYVLNIGNENYEEYPLWIRSCPAPEDFFIECSNPTITVGVSGTFWLTYTPYYIRDNYTVEILSGAAEIAYQNRYDFGIVGLEPGTVEIKVTLDCGMERTFEVEIVEPINIFEEEPSYTTIEPMGMEYVCLNAEEAGYYVVRFNASSIGVEAQGGTLYGSWTDVEEGYTYYYFYLSEAEPSVLHLYNGSDFEREAELLMRKAETPESITILGADSVQGGNCEVGYRLDFGSPWAFTDLNLRVEGNGCLNSWSGLFAYVYIYSGPVTLTATAEHLGLSGSVTITVRMPEILSEMTVPGREHYVMSDIRDWPAYSFTAPEDNHYFFAVIGSRDPYLIIYDTDWQQLDTNDDYNSLSSGLWRYMAAGETVYILARPLSTENVCELTTIVATTDNVYNGGDMGCEHSNMVMEVVEPTCQEGGYTRYTCHSCGYSYNTDHVDPVGHNYEDGFCSFCGQQDMSTFPVLSLDIPMHITIRTQNTGVYLAFVPEYSGQYSFTSLSSDDTRAILYDAQMNRLADNDDGGENYNFLITMNLEAGQTYYLYAYYWSNNIGSYEVLVTDSTPPEPEGTCGDDLTWIVNRDGTLTISGTGEMYDYDSTDTPWYDHRDSILRVVIESGVTGIGNFAFRYCNRLSEAVIAGSVTRIGSGAFVSSNYMLRITFEGDAPAMATDAFSASRALCRYPAGNETWTAEVKKNYDGFVLWAAYDENGDVADEIPMLPLDTLTPVDILVAGDRVRFMFVPDTTDIYTFYSVDGEAHLDTYGHLYDSDGNLLASNDDGMDNGQFRIDYLLEAGRVYYLEARCYNSGITGSFSVYLQKQHNYVDGYCSHCGQEMYITGTCGDELTWALTGSGTLTISGNGAMYEYQDTYQIPWYQYRGYITNIVIESGVTSIGASLFQDCYNLTAVTIGDTVTEIGNFAFQYCSNLTEITIPASVTRVGLNAFAYCYALRQVTFEGDAPVMEENTFYDIVMLNCRYPAGNETWTEEVKRDYGSFIFWYSYDEDGDVVDETPVLVPGAQMPAEIVVAGDRVCFRFVAEYTDKYVFYSEGSQDTYGYLYDCNGNLLRSDDDSGNGNQFKITHVLTAGETYYFVARFYSSNVTGSFDVYLQRNHEYVDGYCSHCGQEMYITGTCGDDLSWVLTGAGILTVSGTGDMYSYEGQYVPWDEYKDYIQTVVIESGVTSIGNHAFQSCYNLTEIVIAESVTEIGDYAFASCDNLTQVTIGNSVTTISTGAFESCYALTEITIPAGVTTIGARAFESSVNLRQVTFEGDAPLMESYIFNSFTVYCRYPAGNETWTEAVKQNYGGFVFWIAYDENGDVADEIPTLVLNTQTPAVIPVAGSRDRFMFVPETTDIYVFYSAGNRDTYGHLYDSQGNHLTSNDDGMGSGQFKVEYLLTAGETYYFEARYYSSSVTGGFDVYLEAKHEYTDGFCVHCGTEMYITGICGDELTWVLDSTGTLTVSGNGEMWSSMNWDGYYQHIKRVVIESGVTGIGYGAFQNCNNLTEVELPDSITYIGTYVFYNCTSLRSINIPSRVTAIGNYTFYNCTALENVALPEGLTEIGYYAFGQCVSLTSIRIPAGVTSIGNHAFSGCTSLTGINIPEGVTYLGNNLFNGCTSLESIAIPEGVTSIGDYAFYDCTALTSVTLPEGLTSIGYSAFHNCQKLESINIPEGVTYLGGGAFYNCTSLTELTLPESLTSIEYNTFYNCTALESINIPDGVGYIGNYAFRNCSSLTEIYIPAGVTYIDYEAFAYCTALQTITLAPITVPALNGSPFYGCDVLQTIYVPLVSYDAYVDTLSIHFDGNVQFIGALDISTLRNLKADLISSATVRFSWNGISGLEGCYYEISRDGEVIATTTDCSFTDTGLTTGVTYLYGVQAISDNGAVSALTELEITTAEPQIRDISTGYYGNMLDDLHNEVFVTVANGNYYGQQDEERTVLQLWLCAEEEVLVGEIFCDNQFAGYSFYLDLSDFADGSYELVAVLTDADGLACSYSEAARIDRDYPEAIVGVTAFGDVNAIYINWAISAEVDTDTYRVYRRADYENEFRQVAEFYNRFTLSYTDTDVEMDTTYYYYIVGVDPLGREGTPSEIVSAAKRPDVTAPNVTRLYPANGTYLSGSEWMQITAEDDLGVTGYAFYYSVDNGESWELLVQLEDMESSCYVDTTQFADGVIRIKGVAWDAAGNESSGLTYVYYIDNTGPSQIQDLTYEATSVTVTLRWSNVPDDDISYFVVEQKNADGSYSVYSYVYSTLGINIYDCTPNTTYTYRVVGYDSRGNRGVPSEDITVTTDSDTTNPVITSLRPAAGYYNRFITLSATATDEHCVASITLQISTDLLTWVELYTQRYTGESGYRTVSYTLDLTQYEESAIYFRAIATDGAGNRSDTSVNAAYVQYIIDRQGPATPTDLVAAGGNGYIMISWPQGTENDLSGYYLYRAESEDGEYTLIASGIRYLNYYDRNVDEGKTYYYKLAVGDLAGNMSECSATVSATVAEDTEAPVVHAIYPVTGTTIGSGNNEVSISVSDNRSLHYIKIEYSLNGINYNTLYELDYVASYGQYAAVALPISGMEHGSVIYVRASATDNAGNVSDYLYAQYTVDNVAPSVTDMDVAYDEENNCVNITWTGEDADDIVRYSIYRKTGNGAYRLVNYVEPVKGQTRYSYTDTYLDNDSVTYTYKIVAVDACGNQSSMLSDDVATPPISLPDRTAPTAVIHVDTTMEVGVEYFFDGSASSDNTGIVSYAWDFGDGTTGVGNTAIHIYSEVGTYTVTLTVKDHQGNESSTSRTVTVTERSQLGVVTIRVVDENGSVVPGASVYFDLGEENQVIKITDGNGRATFTTNVGVHNVGCFIANNEWLPATKSVVVTSGSDTVSTITIIHQTMIEGNFEINRMTFDEIVAAGIDISDPENQHIVRINVHLTYGTAQTPTETSFMFNMSTGTKIGDGGRIIYSTGGGGGGGGGGGTFRELIPTVFCNGTSEEDIAIAYLDIPIGASFLKEFFDVKLHILNNAASEFKMVDNAVILNLPEGLTLMETASSYSTPIVYIDEIAGQTSHTINWIIRGDKAGSYNLSADYVGTLAVFNEQVSAKFVAEEPLVVYGLSAIKLTMEVNPYIYYDGFYFNLKMENTSDIDIYMPSLEVIGNTISTYLDYMDEEMEDKHSTPEVHLLNTLLTSAGGYTQYIGTDTVVTTLAPGESITEMYAVYNAVGYNNMMHLKNAAYTIEEGMGVNFEIVVKDMDLYDTANAMQKIEDVRTDNEKNRMYRFILGHYNYAYIDESLDRDSDFWTLMGEQFYGFGKAVFSFDFDYNDEETREITRKLVAQLLMDESVHNAVIANMDNKYLEITEKLLKTISGFMPDEESSSLLEEYMSNSENVRELAKTLEIKGLDGFYGRLGLAVGSATISTVITTHSIELDGAFSSALGEACSTIGDVVGAAGKVVTAWNDAAEMTSALINIAASQEEARDLLEMLENNVDQDSAIYDEIVAIRQALDRVQNEMRNQFLQELSEEVVGAITEKVATTILKNCFGVGVGTIYSIAKIIFSAADFVFDWSGDIEDLHVLRVNTSLSYALTSAVNEYGLYPETHNQALYTMKALKYVIKMRLIGEQAFVEMAKEEDAEEYLEELNADMGTSFASLDDYGSYIFALLLQYRDQIFASYCTDLDLPDAPQVTINFLTSSTNEAFSSDYEYSFDGVNWFICDGGRISITPGKVGGTLRVRVRSSETTLAGNLTTVTIPAMPVLLGDISVVYVGHSHRITGLKPGTYQYEFTNSKTLQTLTGVLTVEDDGTIVLPESGVWTYMAIRSVADETAFASQIRYLVTIEKEVSQIIMNQESIEILEGDSAQLTVQVLPEDALDPTVTWTSSNPDVLTVDQNGRITAITSGSAVITATANDGTNIQAQCVVTVLHRHIYDAVVTDPSCTEQGYTTHTCRCGDSYVDSYVEALGHNYEQWYIVIAPLCTEAGLQRHDCEDCDYYETLPVEALGHELISHDAKDPTCTEIGWYDYDTCGRCDYITYKEIEATGHSHEAVVTDPSCTEQGYTTHTCHCGDTYVDSYVDALGHNYEQWYIVIAPLCTVDGLERHDCERCDHYETQAVDALGHDLINHDAQDPTCTEIGWYAYDTCGRCDYTTYVEIEATGHDHVATVTAPTCTERGYTTNVCHCGDTYVDAFVDPLGHELTSHDGQAPTCTEIGWYAYDTCGRCDYTTYVEIEATGHSHEAVVTAPTCTEDGYTTHTCHCGDTYVDSYEKPLGHNYGQWYIVIAPLCTVDGLERHDCERCDHYEMQAVDALGHDLINHDAQDPTCTEIGWYAYDTCGRCDYTTYVEIEATGHSHVATVTAPTCTERGYTTHICHCGDSYVDSFADALGHDLISHDAQAPGCTEVGWYAYDTCSRCDYTTYVEIEATGHSYEATVTAPNCTERGYTTHTCRCGDSYVDSFVDALGHDLISHDGQAPTCTEFGWDAYDTCGRCDYTSYKEIEATGHSHEAVVTDPTCTEGGYTTHTCHCGDTYVDSYVDALGHDNRNGECSRCDAKFATITKQPVSVKVESGNKATVTVQATGDGLTYYWYYKNKGASKFTYTTSFKGNTYSVSMDASRDGRQVCCVVVDEYGNAVTTEVVTLSMAVPASITKQPVSVKVESGKTAKVTVQAIGDGLTYQWYFKNKGASKFTYTASFTGDTYSVLMNASRDGRQVYCVITDEYGNSVMTDVVTLSMVAPATITKQPVSVKVESGKTASVTVQATGDGLTYQWYFKNKGASKFSYTSSFTGDTYSVQMNASRDGRQVYCVITDQYGNSVTSNIVTLSVAASVTITKQPVSVKVASGKTAKVTVQATGDGLTYKWYFKNKGASKFSYTSSFKGNSYSVSMDASRDGRQVYCVITDKYGNTVTTNVVTLSMNAAVTITKQPVSVKVEAGKTAKVTVQATGEGLTYKWYFKNKGSSKFSYTSSFKGNSYSVSMDASRDGRQVYCVITDKYGNTVTTNVVTLSMTAPVKITKQPASVSAAAGKTAKVTVQATGDGLTYKWYFKNKGASKFSYTSSFTGSSYSVSMDASRDGRQVYCVITDKYGNTVTTDIVTLSLS